MKRRGTGRIAAGAVVLALVCGGAGVAIGAVAAEEPDLPQARETAQRMPALKGKTTSKQRGLGDHLEQSRAIYFLGKGVKVSIVGGGADTSHCTREETIDTFVTAGDGEVHPFGFIAKDEGACYWQWSASHFFVNFTRPDGRPLGRGRMFMQGPFPGGRYVAKCLLDEEWVGVRCRETADRTLTISPEQ